MRRSRSSAPILLAALVGSGSAAAQWSSNPAANLAIGNLPGDAAVPKIAAIPGGGCYIAWFDNSTPNYQVRLQRLDAAGVEQWPHNGVVVSANPQNTSLVGWDIIADSLGTCVLTFTDVRNGPDLDVYAYRVDQAGAMMWGANGVTLSSNGDTENNPTVCETDVGDFAFVWSNNTTAMLRLQRLDQGGTPLYPGDGLAIPGDVGGNPAFAHIARGTGGDVIVAWVRALSFSATKHIHAQKFDIAGNALWNGGVRLPVFDLVSLPIAHDPRLVGDGVGGAFVGWHYAVGSAFSARIQHLASNGTELFGHNGIDVVVNANSKFDPALAIDVPTQSCTVVWNERNIGQTQWGIFAQKFDAAGAAQWNGGSGVTLIPINTVEKLAPVAVPYAGGTMAFVLETVGALNRQLDGFRVDGAGNVAWSTLLSMVPNDKLRIQAAVSPSGMAMVCWSDARAAAGNDIYAQNVGANGILAPLVAATLPYGCGGNPAGSLSFTGTGALGTTLHARIDNPLGTQAVGSFGVVAYAFAPQPNYPCGALVPGFGMSGFGAAGEILIDVTAPELVFGGPWGGVGLPADVPLPVPANLILYGVQAYVQGALVDPSPGAQVQIGVTTAARVTVGF